MRYTDCIKDNYYRYCYGYGRIVIGKCRENNNYNCYFGADLQTRFDGFWNYSCCFACSFVENASPKEIAWLESCHSMDLKINFEDFEFNNEIEYEIY